MNCPKNVVIAVRLLYVSLVVEFAGFMLSLPKEFAYWKEHPATLSDPVFFSSVTCIGYMFVLLGVMTFLTYQISKGVDIARVIFTSLFVLGLMQTLTMMFCMPVANGLGLITYFFKVVAQGGAAYLLFSKPAVAWFRKELAENNGFGASQNRSSISQETISNTADPALSSVTRITTAVLGVILFIMLFMFISVFAALENCPGGDGYKSDGSIEKSFTSLKKQLNELNVQIK